MTDVDVTQTPVIDEDKIVQKAKDELIASLSGNKNENKYGWGGTDPKTGRPAPKDWDEIPEKILQRAESIAEEKAQKLVDERLKARDEEEKKKFEDANLKKEKDRESLRNEMSRDFFNLVQLGEIDPISKEVEEKLQSGKTYNDLTEEEKKDPGLVAWNKLQELHITNLAAKKTSSLVETYKNFYKPASRQRSKEAPVMGNDPSYQSNDDDMPTLEEIRENARQKGGR